MHVPLPTVMLLQAGRLAPLCRPCYSISSGPLLRVAPAATHACMSAPAAAARSTHVPCSAHRAGRGVELRADAGLGALRAQTRRSGSRCRSSWRCPSRATSPRTVRPLNPAPPPFLQPSRCSRGVRMKDEQESNQRVWCARRRGRQQHSRQGVQGKGRPQQEEVHAHSLEPFTLLLHGAGRPWLRNALYQPRPCAADPFKKIEQDLRALIMRA